MLIYAAPAIIWMIMRLMKKIMLTWPNPFNAWMCIFATMALGIIVIDFLIKFII
jgi:hypothetical protein